MYNFPSMAMQPSINYSQFDMPRTYQQPTNNIIRVNGENGAKAFQMNVPNSSVVLFDENENVFYLKTTDGACFPTLRYFDFNERNVTAEPTQTEFINRTELDEFRKEMQDYVQQFISKSGNKQNFPTNANGKQPKAEQSRNDLSANV